MGNSDNKGISEKPVEPTKPKEKYDPTNVKTFPVPSLPKDDEGFVQSFNIEDTENYMKFFEEFGFVVINNIISSEEIDATLLEIWNELESKIHSYRGSEKVLIIAPLILQISRDNPKTWTDDHWPQAVRQLGILIIFLLFKSFLK